MTKQFGTKKGGVAGNVTVGRTFVLRMLAWVQCLAAFLAFEAPGMPVETYGLASLR